MFKATHGCLNFAIERDKEVCDEKRIYIKGNNNKKKLLE